MASTIMPEASKVNDIKCCYKDVHGEMSQSKKNMGFSVDTLENARRLFLTYQDRISATVFRKFAVKKSQTVFEKLSKEQPFAVSWSHYLQLMRIENKDERKFYEIESAKSSRGIRTLQRQYNLSLYERLALSRDKKLLKQSEMFSDCEVAVSLLYKLKWFNHNTKRKEEVYDTTR